MTRKTIFAVALSVIPLWVLFAWSPWSRLLYRGDGEFSDQLFFFPRYRVRFKDIPLNSNGEYHFRFWGLPSEEMSLELYVRNPQGSTLEDRKLLTKLQATIEASLTDAKGNVACHAVGRPSDDNRDGVWVLMSGPGEAAYWHYECNFVRVFPYRSYDLFIRVSDVGQNIENIEVTPTLKGGGIELP